MVEANRLGYNGPLTHMGCVTLAGCFAGYWSILLRGIAMSNVDQIMDTSNTVCLEI